jgi:hypothetical protein
VFDYYEGKMNWHYGNPIVNGSYICCVKGFSRPMTMEWHEGRWGYMTDGDFMFSGFDNEAVICYIGFDEIPMPEGW